MKRKKTAVTIAVVSLIVIVFAVAVVLVAGPSSKRETEPTASAEPTAAPAEATEPAAVVTASSSSGFDAYFSASRVYAASDSDIAASLPVELGEGLTLVNIGFFNGVFVEDGSMTMVYNVLAVVVTNTSDKFLKKAEITIPYSGGEAVFVAEMLPAGSSAVVLEKSADDYSGKLGSDYVVDSVSFTDQLNELTADALKIEPVDGLFTVTNVSGKRINGDITIHYKYYLGDTILGGADFCVTIEGGLADGQVTTVKAEGFSAEACAVTVITLG